MFATVKTINTTVKAVAINATKRGGALTGEQDII